MTINLPRSLVRELEITARRHQRTLSGIVRDLIMQAKPALPTLPDKIEAELAALPNLSDDVLWLVARNTLTKTEQDELAVLNQQAKQTPLTEKEEASREALLATYNHMMVRRAQAASLLTARGHDLSDPAVLQ